MKKSFNIFLSLVLGLSFFISAFSQALPAVADEHTNTEILYLSDTLGDNDGQSVLYQIALVDDTIDKAVLTPVAYASSTGVFPFNHLDAIAASPDGAIIYLIDDGPNSTHSISKYHINTNILDSSVAITGMSTNSGDRIDQTAVAPDGTIYVSDVNNESLYTLNPNTGTTTLLGIVKNGTITLNVYGADLIFAQDGTLYLWTNGSKTGALAGLYTLDYENPVGGVITATYLGPGTNVPTFTGLAIRENGVGDLVASQTTNDSIILIDKTDGSLSTAYRMYKGNVEYAYTFGDMTAGPIISPLHIDKTVKVDYTRTWEWDVTKTSTTTALTLAIGESYLANYDVTVTATSTDSDWTVSGLITIHNPNIMAAEIMSINDVIGTTTTTTASTTCFVDVDQVKTEVENFPYMLGQDETMLCDYEAEIPGDDTINIATVTTNPEGVVPGNSIEKDVIAGLPTNEYDEEATLYDNKYGAVNGTLVATSTPYYFDYYLLVGPYTTSGAYQFENIATVTASDTAATSSDNHLININVPVVETGCTLTQGYWKNHSEYGHAPYDDNWDGLENEIFYDSEQTYYEVLWTAPKGGNAYYQLAHQYIAAYLNKLNGASVPSEVETALSDAAGLFNSNTPAEIGALKGNDSVRKHFLDLASLLADYNEGKIGPGHCSD